MHQNITSQNPPQLPAAQAVAGGSSFRVVQLRAEVARLKSQALRLADIADQIEREHQGRRK